MYILLKLQIEQVPLHSLLKLKNELSILDLNFIEQHLKLLLLMTFWNNYWYHICYMLGPFNAPIPSIALHNLNTYPEHAAHLPTSVHSAYR
jgi:hypothetical protein